MVKSRIPFAATVAALSKAIVDGGNTIFATIDQAAAAASAGLSLRPTCLIVFGNPKGGTGLMQDAPMVALDLPLKILIWEEAGTVSVAWTSMSEIAHRYGIAGKDAQIGAMDRALAALAASVA